MSDEVWRRERVESPCIRLCVIHPPSGLCLGCYRTMRGDRRLAGDDAGGAAGGDGGAAGPGAADQARAARRPRRAARPA